MSLTDNYFIKMKHWETKFKVPFTNDIITLKVKIISVSLDFLNDDFIHEWNQINIGPSL